MNIYELDKQAMPAPLSLFVAADGQAPAFLLRCEDITGNQLVVAQAYDKKDAGILKHCRNNFMKALAALKECYFQFEHNGEESDSDKDVLDSVAKTIEELEEVEV